MQVLEKNIKGFNLLELLIVIVIMGFVSAVAYPNLSGWSKERKARGAAIKIKSLMEKINAQVQRGNYAFVQVFFNADTTMVEVKSRGMKISTLNSKINDGGNVWNADATSRCNIISDTYWDDDPDEVDIMAVQKIELDEVMVNFEGTSAICFSKNAKWFSGAGTFVTGAGDDIAIDDVRDFLVKFRSYLKSSTPQLLSTIKSEKKLSPESEESLKKAIADAKAM